VEFIKTIVTFSICLRITIKSTKTHTMEEIKKRLEFLRRELRLERISYGELAELQSLIEYIDLDDVELLQAAGVPEK